jgi:hypothetical protein
MKLKTWLKWQITPIADAMLLRHLTKVHDKRTLFYPDRESETNIAEQIA